MKRKNKLNNLQQPQNPSVELAGSVSVVDELALTPDQEITPEREAVVSAGRDAKIALRDPRVRQVFMSMICLRQMYAVAYQELRDSLTNKGLQEMTEDVLIGAAMYEAAKPFDQHKLAETIMAEILPWLGRIIDNNTVADRNAAITNADKSDAERRIAPIDIGVAFTGISPNFQSISRQRPLVLVGWKNVLYWLTDMIVENVKNTHIVAHLALNGRQNMPNVVQVNEKLWRGCVNKATSLRALTDTLPRTLDLLVVDDLSSCYTDGFIGRPAAANAGTANKYLNNWCKETGSAMLACIPLARSTDSKDLRAPEFEALRTFTDVRDVIVTEEGENYRVSIGGDATVLFVEKEVLDTYTGGSLHVE